MAKGNHNKGSVEKSMDQTTGKTKYDLLTRFFSKKAIQVISLIIFVILIILIFLLFKFPINYVYQEAKKGREVSINLSGFSLGEDPYLASNVQATCSALLPTKATAPVPIVTPSQTEEPTTMTYDCVNVKENCIPLGWSYFSSNNSSITPIDGCLDFSSWGITGSENGISFTPEKTTDMVVRGLFLKIPKQKDPLSFNITLEKLYRSDSLASSPYFFIGSYNSLPTGSINGDFVTFFVKGDNSTYMYGVTNDPITSVLSEVTLTKPESQKFYSEEIIITFTDIDYSIQVGSESKPIEKLQNLAYFKEIDGNKYINLTFGMRLPQNDELKVYVTGLNLISVYGLQEDVCKVK